MSKINQRKLYQIKNLYREGRSMREISEYLGFSPNEVCYFFRKNNIKRRNRIESNSLKFKNKSPSFKLKTKFNHGDLILKTIGVMLYWGEGSKWKGEKIVDLANSDPYIIKLFLVFLRKICGIDEKKLRGFVYCYKDQNIEKIIKYWAQVTKIPRCQFTKPYIRDDFNNRKSGKMSNGLIHIRYNDKKLLLKIMQWIDEYKNLF
jgi:hypothetical protein